MTRIPTLAFIALIAATPLFALAGPGDGPGNRDAGNRQNDRGSGLNGGGLTNYNEHSYWDHQTYHDDFGGNPGAGAGGM